jgi:serine/threonine protein kinase
MMGVAGAAGFVCPECGARQPAEGRCSADGALLAPIGEDVLLGTTIGAYRVARLLGIGGMGRVYKGVHPTIGSRVAIKVLSRECTDRRELVERFFAEAKAVNMIRHESIVNVLDLATLPDGRPYIIMEYLDGAPLASIIDHAAASGAPLPIGGLARLAVEVLDALSAAHAKGIIHRDLKPDNIYVTPSGRPKVLDFGIAKLSEPGAGSSTRTGSLLGTPHYMSPEQAAGKVVDQRADVYAIGVILFEAATGQKPFQGESLFELLRKQVEEPPPAPRSLRPDLPAEVESVILTALAKAPEHRFGSAQAMSMALQHATAHLAAEQWVPITGAGTHRAAPSGGWQPTPPASWGSGSRPQEPAPGPSWGSGSRPQEPAPGPSWGGGSRPQEPAPGPSWGSGSRPDDRVPPAWSGHPSTVSGGAGQVQPRQPQLLVPARRAPSRAGLWIGLSAVVAVGGAVAAAVTLGGSGSNGVGGASGSALAVGSGGSSAAGGTEQGKPDQAGDGDDDGDGGDAASEAAGHQIEAALKNLDAIDTSALPPAARKQIEDMKQLAKLPPKERLARLKQLARGMPKDLTGGLAEAMDTIDQAAGGGTGGTGTSGTGTSGTGGTGTSGGGGGAKSGASAASPWVATRDLAYPGYDPRRLDVSAFIRWAIDEARKADPDAALFRVDVSGVGPDGTANLELPTLASDHGSLDLRFFSAARARPDPSVPIGVPQRDKVCEFRIEAEPDGVRLRPISGFDCKGDLPIPPPRCTAAALWKRALAAKAPQNAVASLGYRAWSGRFRWGFDIGFGSDRAYSHVFDDDC